MKRKEFLKNGLAAGTLMGTAAYATGARASNLNVERIQPGDGVTHPDDEVVVERAQSGKPHAGAARDPRTRPRPADRPARQPAAR
ncbi:MAG: hypothetical protein ACQER4_09635, partial [Bacteroidota bacterium]